MEINISFIGAGAMAEALISGWLKKSYLRPDQITVTNRGNDNRLVEMRNYYHVQTTRDPKKVVKPNTCIIISCKPKDWQQAITPYQDLFSKETPIISVMAGVETSSLEKALSKKELPVIRTMPNTSATVGASMTTISYGKYVPLTTREKICELFKGVGEIAEVKEEQMDAMTALTGTGPAYIYYLMEAMEIAAENMGIESELAKKLVSQTLLGAALRVQESNEKPAQLYKQIMSPGGTTEAGFHVLKERQVQEALIACILRAYERSKELGNPLVMQNTNNSIED